MATAEKVMSVVRMEPVMELRVKLDLSADEARTIHDLFQFIGGSPSKSRRKHLDAISQALHPIFGHAVHIRDIQEPYNLMFMDSK